MMLTEKLKKLRIWPRRLKNFFLAIAVSAALTGSAYASSTVNTANDEFQKAQTEVSFNAEIVDRGDSKFNIDRSLTGEGVETGFEVIGKDDGLNVAYRNQWNNDNGFVYAFSKTEAGNGAITLSYNNIGGEGQFYMETSDKGMQPVMKIDYGQFPDTYFPVVERIGGNQDADYVNVRYLTGSEIIDSDIYDKVSSKTVLPISISQWMASEINWNTVISSKEKIAKVKTIDGASTTIMNHSSNLYAGSAYNTATLIFNDSDGNRIVRDFNGTFDSLKDEVDNIVRGFNLSKEDVSIVMYDSKSMIKDDTESSNIAQEESLQHITIEDGSELATLPVDTTAENNVPLTASGDLVFLLSMLAARRKRKAFIEEYKRSGMTEFTPEKAYDYYTGKTKEEVPSETGETIATRTLPFKFDFSLDPSTKKIGDRGKVKSPDKVIESIFNRATTVDLNNSFEKQLNIMIARWKKDPEFFQGHAIVAGISAPGTGEITHFISVTFNQGAALINMKDISRGKYTKLSEIPIEEFIERIEKDGHAISVEEFEVAKLESSMIWDDKKAEEAMMKAEKKYVANEGELILGQEEEEELRSKEESTEISSDLATDSDKTIEQLIDEADSEMDHHLARIEKKRSGMISGSVGRFAGMYIDGKWETLYDEYGNRVENYYFKDQIINNYFYFRFEEDDTYSSGKMYFLGEDSLKEYHDSVKKGEKPTFKNVFYEKDFKKYDIEYATIHEVFKTDGDGRLLIDTPEVNVGDPIYLIKATKTLWPWSKAKNVSTMPILIYQAEDVNNDGTPKPNTFPIDIVATIAEASKKGYAENILVNKLRKEMKGKNGKKYFKSTIKMKSDGFPRKSYAGPLARGKFKLGAYQSRYEVDDNGKWKLKNVDQLRRRYPIILSVMSNGSIGGARLTEDLFQGEKEAVSNSSYNFKKNKKIEDKAGVSVELIPTANGHYKYRMLNQRRLNVNEFDYVKKNLTSLLQKEMLARKNYITENPEKSLRKNPNYVEGLSEVIPTNYISHKDRKRAIKSGQGMASLYKKGAINFTDYTVIVEMEGYTTVPYIELSFSQRPTRDLTEKHTLSPAFDIVMNGTVTGLVPTTYNPATGESFMAVWDELNKYETPRIVNVNKEGFYIDRFGNINDKAVYYELGPRKGAGISNRINETLANMRRNVLFEDGERTLLNNEYDEFIDPVNPDRGPYKSYMDFLAEEEVVVSSIDPNNPIEGSTIYSDHAIDEKDEKITSEIVEEIEVYEDEESEIEEDEEDIEKEVATPSESVNDTGVVKESVNLDNESAIVEKMKTRISTIAKENDLSLETIYNALDASYLYVDDPTDHDDIRKLLKTSFDIKLRRISNGELDIEYNPISEEEWKWFADNIGDRGAVINAKNVSSRGTIAWGYYWNGIATVAQHGKQGTAYHEAFHTIFDLGHTNKQKDLLYEEAGQRYKDIDSKDLVALEEAMADEFMSFRIKYENGEIKPMSKIEYYFKSIIASIKAWFGLEIGIDNMMRLAAQGYYKNILRTDNSLGRLTPMNRNVIPYRQQEVAISYLKNAVNRVIFGVRKSIDNRNKKVSEKNPDKLTQPLTFNKVISSRGGIRNIVNGIAKFDFDNKTETGHPTLIGGTLFNDIERTSKKIGKIRKKIKLLRKKDAELNKEEKGRLKGLDKEINKYRNFNAVLIQMRDNWNSKILKDENGNEVEFGNSRTGFDAILIQILNDSGISTVLQDKKVLPGKKSTQDVEANKEPEQDDPEDELVNGASDEFVDMIYGREAHAFDRRKTFNQELKSWLSNTSIYDFYTYKDDPKRTGEVKTYTNEDGEIVKSIKIDSITGQIKTVNFDRIYNKLQKMLYDLDFPEMIIAMERASLEDHEIASIWEKLKESRNSGVNYYELFFSSMNLNRRNMRTVRNVGGFNAIKFEILDTNRQGIHRAIVNDWRSKAKFYNSTGTEDLIDPVIAKIISNKAQSLISNAHRIRSDKAYAKDLSEEDKALILNQYVKELILVLKAFGVEVDENMFASIIDTGFDSATNKLNDIVLGKKGQAKDYHKSIEAAIDNLVKGMDIYAENKQMFKKLAEMFKNYLLDIGAESYKDVNGNMVFGINLNYAYSKKISRFKSDNYWESEIDFYEKDSFYHDNLYIEMVKNNDYRDVMELITLDGITSKYGNYGHDYQNSTSVESKQVRLAMYFDNQSKDYFFVNTGTKSDKGQSLYLTVPKLSSSNMYTKYMNIETENLAPGQRPAKSSYMDVAKMVLKNTIEQERSRISRLRELSKDKAWVKKFGIKNEIKWDKKNNIAIGNGLLFNYIPAINNIENIYTEENELRNYDDGDELLKKRESEIDNVIKNFLEDIIANGIDELISSRMAYYEDGILKGNKSSIPQSLMSNIEEKLREFFVNEFTWNLELSKVFMGDLTIYEGSPLTKNSQVIDYMKRGYQTTTPGISPFIEDGSNSDFGISTIVMNDIFKRKTLEDAIEQVRVDNKDVINEEVQESYNELIALREKDVLAKLKVPKKEEGESQQDYEKRTATQRILNNYLDSNKTDGWSVMNIEAYKLIHSKTTLWGEMHDYMYNKYWKDDADIFKIMEAENRTALTEDELKELRDGPKLEPMKPYYYGQRWSEDHNAIVTEQYKNSIFVVTRLMAEGYVEDENNFRDLHKKISGQDKDFGWGDKVEPRIMLFDSAIKIGLYGAVNYDSDDKAVPRNLPLKNFRIPQNIESKKKNLINNGTQQSKLIMGNVLDEDEGFTLMMNNQEQYNGRQIKAMFNGTWTEILENAEINFIKALGLEDDFTIPTDPDKQLKFLKKLKKILINENINRQLVDNYNDALDIIRDIDGNFKYKVPIDFPSIGNKYENIIATLYKKTVLQQKVPGFSLAQIADYGTRTSDELKFIRRTEDGKIQAAEIALSASLIRDVLGVEMQPGLVDEMELTSDQRKALEMIGYRIPTQGKGSMLPIVVKRVLPDTIGAAIMVPAEISNQQGSDYDIDKMFIMTRVFNKKKKSVVKYEVPLTKKNRYRFKKNNKNQRNNLIFDLTWAVLTHDKHIRETMLPMRVDSLRDRIKYYEDLEKSNPELQLFDKNRTHHIAAFHTNLYFERLNKFSKNAVGIIANASTAQVYYETVDAGLKKEAIKDDDNKIIGYSDINDVFIVTDKTKVSKNKFVNRNEDNEYVSEFLKRLGSAALDNAKEPLLGLLGVNSATINVVLILANLGYSEKVVFDFVKQPIIKRFADLIQDMNTPDFRKVMNTFMKYEVSSVFKEEYQTFNEIHYNSKSPIKITAKELNRDLGKDLSKLNDESRDTQVRVLSQFVKLYRQGMDIGALNKMLAPDRSKLNGFAQLYEFNHLYEKTKRLTYSNFYNKPSYSDIGRVSAFHRALRKYSSIASQLFVNYSLVHQKARGAMAAMTEMKASKAGDINAMNAFINYALLTKNPQIFTKLTASKDKIHDMFYAKGGKSMPGRLMKIKKGPFSNNQLIINLDANNYNDQSLYKSLYFNNSVSRVVGEKNEIINAWRGLLELKPNNALDENERKAMIEVKKFARDLVTYSIVGSGLDLNFNMPHEYIPLEYWNDYNDSKVIDYWRNLTKSLLSNIHTFKSDDFINLAIQFVRSNPKATTSIGSDFINGNIDKIEALEDRPENPTFRVKSPSKVGGSIKTFDYVVINEKVFKSIKSGKFKPFIKYYNRVKDKMGEFDKKMSGYRLLALAEVEYAQKNKDENKKDNHVLAKYVEIQWLGVPNKINEVDWSRWNTVSLHPIHDGVSPSPESGFFILKDEESENIYKWLREQAKLDQAEYDGKNSEEEDVRDKEEEEIENEEQDDDTSEKETDTDMENIDEHQGNDAYPDSMASLTSMQSKIEPSKAMQNAVQQWLRQNGISTIVDEELKQKFGTDAEAIADIANMTIRIANEENQWKDLPEEAAHFYVEGLRNLKSMRRLIQRAKDDPLYEQVVKEYGERYNHNEDKLARETAAKLIAKHLIAGVPVKKNWLRRLLDTVKLAINDFFKNLPMLRNFKPFSTDAFAIEAEKMLSFKKDNMLNFLGNYEIMYSVETMPNSVKNILGENSDFNPEMTKIDWGKADREFSIENVSDKMLKKLDSFKEKTSEGLEIKLRKLKNIKSEGGKQAKARLKRLKRLLEQDQTLRFIKKYMKSAKSQLNYTDKVLNSMDEDGDRTSLNKLDVLQNQLLTYLGTFDYMVELTALVAEMYVSQDLKAQHSSFVRSMQETAGAIDTINKRIVSKRLELTIDVIETESKTTLSKDEIAAELETSEGDISIADKLSSTLIDTKDDIIGAASYIVVNRMHRANTEFLSYLRGSSNTKGSDKAIMDFVESRKAVTGSSKFEDIYGRLIRWNKKKERYEIVQESIINMLSQEEKEFYEIVLKPYIELNEKLIKKGYGADIKNPRNMPNVLKTAFEQGLTISAGKRKLKEELIDNFVSVKGQEEFYRTDEKGNIIKRVPIKYTSKMNKENLSMDLGHAILVAMEDRARALQMADIEPFVSGLIDILETRSLVVYDLKGKPRTKPNEMIRSHEKFKSITDFLLYGKTHNEGTIEVTIPGVDKKVNIDSRKTSGAIRRFISFAALGFNYLAYIMNPIVMAYFSFIKGVGGKDYTMKDWGKAVGTSVKNMVGMMGDYNNKRPSNKQTLIMERIGLFSHGLEDVQMSQKGSLFKNFLTKLAYSGFKLGNAMVQPVHANAYMNAKKITLKDNSEITMAEMYDFKDGRLSIREDVIDAIGAEGVENLEMQVRDNVRMVSDNSGMSNTTYTEQSIIGEFIMMHRKWMGPMIENLLAGVFVDNITGEYRGGTWNTSLRLLGKALTQQNVSHLKAMLGHAELAKMGEISPFTGKPYTEEELALYKSNARQFVAHVGTWVALMFINMSFDDDDESYLKWLTVRFKAEIMAMIAPDDLLRVARRPTAAITYIDKATDFVWYHTAGLFIGDGDEILQSGPNKGITRRAASRNKANPFRNLLQEKDLRSLIDFYE